MLDIFLVLIEKNLGVDGMFSQLLSQNEGKTLEFKQNAQSITPIVKTVVAFANTAGGIIIVGIEDKSKKIIGVENVLKTEEQLASTIADSIEPMLYPDIEIVSHGQRELLIIRVPYLIGPYYLKQKGIRNGTYIRFGSTNRLADAQTLASLLCIAKHTSFDETPCTHATIDDLDHAVIVKTLKPLYKTIQKEHYEALNLIVIDRKKYYPTYGALLLFSKNKQLFLPDSMIRCVCFSGVSRERILDQKDIISNLIDAIDEIIIFIERHTNLAAKIGKVKRQDIPQFPSIAVREAIINALVHADYSIKGASIQVAVFSNRIEITNPGALPFGQLLKSALSGFSKSRNHLLVRIFRELKLIERLGSGIPNILESYKDKMVPSPNFEEAGDQFRVTLYEITEPATPSETWEVMLMQVLKKGEQLGTKDIAKLWSVEVRTARMRLNKMLQKGLIQRKAKSKTDPKALYGM